MASRLDESMVFRVAEKRDAPTIARLLTELGHANTQEDISERWPQWISIPGNEVILASLEDRTVGLAILGQTPSLYRSFPVGRIWALIITEQFRNRGIGRKFLKEIEARFIGAGCGMIELTSNVVREDAHRFYLQFGYEKSSFRFAKKLK